jgi:hypothetical protein
MTTVNWGATRHRISVGFRGWRRAWPWGLLGGPSPGVTLLFERKLLLGVVLVFGGDRTPGLARQVIYVAAFMGI